MAANEQFDGVLKKVASKGLPLPRKPTTKDPEFDFPEDPSSLSGVKLSQMMGRFTAWYAYTQRLFGLLDSELTLVDAEYRLLLVQGGLKLRTESEYGKRPSADIIEAAVLAEADDDLLGLRDRRLELAAIKVMLSSRILIYERCYAALSRELTRREMEARIQGP
jgi:hypothetical protein